MKELYRKWARKALGIVREADSFFSREGCKRQTKEIMNVIDKEVAIVLGGVVCGWAAFCIAVVKFAGLV